MIDPRDARLRELTQGPTTLLEDATSAAAQAATAGTLSFVIPVRNDAVRLARCLASIRDSLGDVQAEIIVADNGSTDRSADVAREAGARVLHLPGRRVGEVRNLAAASAYGDLLAFVDADHELVAGWVAAALAAMKDPSTIAAGDYCHAPSGGTRVQQMVDCLRTRRPGLQPVDWLGSGNLVVRRTAFEAAGGFDVGLETCEDVDLCQRLRALGGRIMAVEGMVNIHHGDPPTLKALFAGELWRGRDNLRVSLRAPLTLRSAPGLAIPVLMMVAMFVAAVGLVALPWTGPFLLASGLAAVATLIVPHAALLWRRTSAAERGLDLALLALQFSAVYNSARALALVFRAGHRVRKTGSR